MIVWRTLASRIHLLFGLPAGMHGSARVTIALTLWETPHRTDNRSKQLNIASHAPNAATVLFQSLPAHFSSDKELSIHSK